MAVLSTDSKGPVLSTLTAVYIMIFCLLTPYLTHLLVRKSSQKIMEEDETTMKYFGTLFDGVSKSSTTPLYFNSILCARKVLYATTVCVLYRFPLYVLVPQTMISICMVFYYVKYNVLKKSSALLIGVLSEIALGISFSSVAAISMPGLTGFTQTVLEYIVMGINVLFILLVTIINVYSMIKRRTKKAEVIPVDSSAQMKYLNEAHSNGLGNSKMFPPALVFTPVTPSQVSSPSANPQDIALDETRSIVIDSSFFTH